MSFQKFQEECQKLVKEYGVLERPPKDIGADLALPCFTLAKKLKKNPTEIAKDIAGKIWPGILIEKIEALGPYVNFYANWKKLGKTVIEEVIRHDSYGSSDNKGTVMVEYSSPNSNKPLHVGHLRNDSIGMSISNILEFFGFKVVKANLVNDRGIHICKSMLAYKKWGKGMPNKKGDHFVGDFYVMFEKKKTPEMEKEIQVMLKNWEQKDKETRELWKKMNKWAIDGFKETYKEFGSEFDVFFFESQFYDKAKAIVEEGLKKKVFFRDEKGAVVAKIDPLPKKIILREDGTSIYITNDLALTEHKFKKYRLNKSIWCVGSEQNLYFRQLFKIFELLGYKWAKNCYHLSYGMVLLPGGKMKTREGTVIDADDLIEEVRQLAEKEVKKRYPGISKAELEDRSKHIALGAIKYYLLKMEPVRDLLFDSKKAVSFEGDTGPYLQYTYARAKSILRKSKKKPAIKDNFTEKETEIIKKISLFPEIIDKCARELKPHHLANYLSELAAVFNEFYHSQKVIDSEKEPELLALIQSVAVVMKNGLRLLGIKTLEKM